MYCRILRSERDNLSFTTPCLLEAGKVLLFGMLKQPYTLLRFVLNKFPSAIFNRTACHRPDMVMEDPSAAFPPSSNGPDFPARFDVT